MVEVVKLFAIFVVVAAAATAAPAKDMRHALDAGHAAVE